MTSASISEGRIERAAKAIWEVNHPNPPAWSAWGDKDGWGPSISDRSLTIRQSRAALEADAPEIAAAEARGKIEGLKEAEKTISQALCDVSVDQEMFMEIREHFASILDVRIIALTEVAER